VTAGRTTLAAGALAAGVVAVDQVVKALVRDELALGERRDLVAGFDLVHVRNSGIAFGFLTDGGTLLVVGTVIALLALVVFFVTHAARPLVWLPTGLLLGGAVGNLIDRAREGWVTDFIKFPHFPAFNVADIAITFGVVALVYVLEGPPRRQADAARGPAPEIDGG
jgi:signal peptidase II